MMIVQMMIQRKISSLIFYFRLLSSISSANNIINSLKTSKTNERLYGLKPFLLL